MSSGPLRMPQAPGRGAAIWGVGAHLPAEVVANEQLIAEGQLPVSARWIQRHTGVESRHRAAPHEAASDLALPAAQAALAEAGVEAHHVDRIFLATISPDHPTPATASFLAHALGARCLAFDVVAACAGFVVALDLARAHVVAGGGPVLVVASEVRSRWLKPSDPRTAALFGDGAGAAVVGPCPAGQGFLSGAFGTDGEHALAVHVPAGGSRRPASAETLAEGLHHIAMADGRMVGASALDGTASLIASALEAAQWKPEDLDLLVAHQPNGLLFDALVRRLGLPAERAPRVVHRTANATAATTALALAEAWKLPFWKHEAKVLLMAMGGGFTAGAMTYLVPSVARGLQRADS